MIRLLVLGAGKPTCAVLVHVLLLGDTRDAYWDSWVDIAHGRLIEGLSISDLEGVGATGTKKSKWTAYSCSTPPFSTIMYTPNLLQRLSARLDAHVHVSALALPDAPALPVRPQHHSMGNLLQAQCRCRVHQHRANSIMGPVSGGEVSPLGFW